MLKNWQKSFEKVLKHEGGYVNHPKDPGGATNMGVIQRTYDRHRRAKGLAPKDVRHITRREVAEIYKKGYWDTVRADDLPSGVDYFTFDGSVNSGPSQSAKWLQRSVGSPADGQVGPATLKAVRAAPDDLKVIKDMARRRMGFLRGLRHWSTFGRGWTRRVSQAEADALVMAGGMHALQDAIDAIAPQTKKEVAGGTTGIAATVGTTVQTAATLELPTWAPWLAGGLVLAVIAIIMWRRIDTDHERKKTFQAILDRL